MTPRMLAPIHSIKHYLNVENNETISGNRRSIAVVDAVSSPAPGSPSEVTEGAVVKAVFLEFWLSSNAGNNMKAKFQFSLEYAPSGVDTIDFTELNNLNTYTNKKNILFFLQGVLGQEDGQGSIPVVRQWFKIPKGKQRFGLGTRLLVAISATSNSINTCGFATYKEYT